MAIQAIGSIYALSKRKRVVYLPVEVAFDSQFPFRNGERVLITIRKAKLLVEKVPASAAGRA
jgi:hypothetical protein